MKVEDPSPSPAGSTRTAPAPSRKGHTWRDHRNSGWKSSYRCRSPAPSCACQRPRTARPPSARKEIQNKRGKIKSPRRLSRRCGPAPGTPCREKHVRRHAGEHDQINFFGIELLLGDQLPCCFVAMCEVAIPGSTTCLSRIPVRERILRRRSPRFSRVVVSHHTWRHVASQSGDLGRYPAGIGSTAFQLGETNLRER